MGRPAWLRCALWALIVVVLQCAAVVLYFRVERARTVERAPRLQYEQVAGGPAVDLLLERPDGTSRSLADLRGRFVLLHFWATWCPPCREEIPALIETGRQLARERKLELVAVSLDEDWAALREFFRGKIPAEVYLDRGRDRAERLDFSTLPETLLLAPDGRPVLRFEGAREWRGAEALDLLRGQTAGSILRSQ